MRRACAYAFSGSGAPNLAKLLWRLPPRRRTFSKSGESALREQALIDELAELVALARDARPPESVRFTELVHRVVDEAGREARGRGVKVELESPAPPVRAVVLADHVTWALRRLLAQAVEAAAPSGVVTARVAAEQGMAVLAVRATAAPTLGGSRLAVAVARAAIERQGGELRVPELAEGGVVLEVRLPLDRSGGLAVVPP